MNFGTSLMLAPLLIALALPAMEAKDGAHKSATESEKAAAKRHKRSEKQLTQQRKKSEVEWRQRTEGHRPQDLDGDGIINRHEWPGSDASFRELDWDGDGVLSDRDRRRSREAGHGRVYDRDGRWIR